MERYLHDLLQYALGVLHIVTLVPSSRKMIVNATLSNNRVGTSVILDAANIASNHVDPEVMSCDSNFSVYCLIFSICKRKLLDFWRTDYANIWYLIFPFTTAFQIIQPALNVLVNLVCPPPSISNKPALVTQGQQSASAQASSGPMSETRDRTAERNASDRSVNISSQTDPRERNEDSSAVDRDSAVVVSTQTVNGTPQTPVLAATSGLVGDYRISLGAGAGCAGLAAQLVQGYRQAREAVRANNGIKVLLHLLQPRICSPPAALDCLRALACRVLLGLARDDTIAHILTKLQVNKISNDFYP